MVCNCCGGNLLLKNFRANCPVTKQSGDFATLCESMKPIEINEQYETTHFDGETLRGLETKDEVWVVEFKRGLRGDEGNGERRGDPIMATLPKTFSN